MPGNRPSIAGSTTTMLSGVIILCASLKLFVYTDIGIIIPAKKTVSGSNNANNFMIIGMVKILETTAVKLGSGIKSKNSIDTNKPIKAQQDAMRPDKTTTSILPIKIFHLLTGVVKSVSIVPLSFSPEKRSIAGYMHPKNPNAIKM